MARGHGLAGEKGRFGVELVGPDAAEIVAFEDGGDVLASELSGCSHGGVRELISGACFRAFLGPRG